MGVHGLTTYLHQNQRILADVHKFPTDSESAITTIVVDGWSFIYDTYEQSRLPWVYGGEYAAFTRYVERVVRAWIAVGLTVHVVFDGPSPDLKFPTLVSRLDRTHVHNALLFFRTSPASRTAPRFLHENRIIPPLVLGACVEALARLAKSLGSERLEVHFADEEGDPFAVELAGRLGAYVVGNDSDFVVFNSGRYMGYVPLEDMVWTAPVPVSQSTHEEQGEDGFQTVAKGKKRPQPAAVAAAAGLIPPLEVASSELVLTITVYTPARLASHLNIPTTLLPLLASLVGNDVSNASTTQRNVQSLFFERSLTLSQRITRAATTLASILDAAATPKRRRHRVGSVMDLIDRTVHALLVRSPTSLASGEIDGIVNRIVNAALMYAIDKYNGDVYGPASLWPTSVCALHAPDVCPLPRLFSRALAHVRGEPDESVLTLRTMYVEAYRAGKVQPKLTDVLSTGTFWPRIFLDHPDAENVAITIGRPIREWIYALLEDGVGLGEALEEPRERRADSDEEREGEEDPDELIDVVEDDSDQDADLLAPLRGELRRLHGDDDACDLSTRSVSRSRSRPPARATKFVTEYVRRGTRVAAERVPVPDLVALMTTSGMEDDVDPEAWIPVQLRPKEERMTFFLRVLGSDEPAVRAVPTERLIGVLVVRWVVRALHRRALALEGGKDRDAEKWTRQEALALLSVYGPANDTASQSQIEDGKEANGANDADTNMQVPVTDRNVQLMAQVMTAIETIEMLAQVLFLVDEVPARVETLSGRLFHARLTTKSRTSEGLDWDACVVSLEDAYGVEKVKKVRKPRVPDVPTVVTSPRTAGRGMFSLLDVVG